jgi:OOP family OmpA-OmpF porin
MKAILKVTILLSIFLFVQLKAEAQYDDNSSNPSSENNEEAPQDVKKPVVVWSKYDFIPGETVFFEDGPSQDEENGEFPSRWDLYEGSVEIAEMDGELVIMSMDGGGTIVPYITNSSEDYLPEVFTLELDLYFEPGNHNQRFWIKFEDKKNQWQKGPRTEMVVYVNGMEFQNSEKRYPGTENYNWGQNPIGGWRHIAVAYTKGKFKAYMDDTRLINIPHMEGEPWGITIEAGDENQFIKNIRIAKGGVKYYDRVLSDGKIVVNGIKFDVNKATLKPESMGPINEIFELMERNPEINFVVEGHTDSDGDGALNQSLSEERAKTVMDKLISMGIEPGRLKSAGHGESKPIDNNSSAEGKANNRRVEFVVF